MKNELGSVVQYKLLVGEDEVPLNERLGQTLKITHTGTILCSSCGRRTKKSYAQGHCFPCMKRLASCDMCILKPETCHYAAGTCREPEWGERNCMTTHVVYLANTSSLKIGITRASQVPTRWMDQGATQALPIAEVSTRHVSGLVEIAVARTVADKTNWRAMLNGDGAEIDLQEAAASALAAIEDELHEIREQHGEDAVQPVDAEMVSIKYPVASYADKIKSHNFDKDPVVTGVLQGIKGQYLLLDTGVINIRKFTGYEVIVEE